MSRITASFFLILFIHLLGVTAFASNTFVNRSKLTRYKSTQGIGFNLSGIPLAEENNEEDGECSFGHEEDMCQSEATAFFPAERSILLRARPHCTMLLSGEKSIFTPPDLKR